MAPKPPALRLTATETTFGGSPVPWNGTLGDGTRLASPKAIKVQTRLNAPGSWSMDALFAPSDTGIFPWLANIGAAVDRSVLPDGTLVRLGLTWDAADYVAAGSPNGVGANTHNPLVYGVVEATDINWIDEAPIVSYAGRTHLALLDDVAVYPYGGPSFRPYHEARVFSWASPEFDDSGWGFAQEIVDQGSGSLAWSLDSGWVAPDGWPLALTAQWIWHDNPGGNPSDTSAADVGTCLFRRKWVNATAGRYALFITADNLFACYFDGVEVAANRENPYGWQTTTRFDFSVSAGDHTIAVRGENLAGLSLTNPAGVLAVIKLVNPDGTLSDVSDTTGPLHTDDNWKCLPYVTPPFPGFTAGEVLNILVAEALARDTDAGTTASPLRCLTFHFSDSVDSAGNAWSVLPEITLPVGSSLGDALRTMNEQGGIVFTDANPDRTLSATAALGIWVYDSWPAEVDTHTFTAGTDLVAFTYRLGGG